MVFITPVTLNHLSSASRSKRKAPSSSAGFAHLMHEAEQADASGKSAATSSIAVSNPLFGLQEISDDDYATKQAVRHGHISLDMLDDLRMALMSGGIPASMLERIQQLAEKQRQTAPDAALSDILDDIELRVAVELAKLEMALENQGH